MNHTFESSRRTGSSWGRVVAVAACLAISFGLLSAVGGCLGSGGKFPVVVLETSEANIELELFPNVAPKSVETFLRLVNEGFYDSLKFHRVIDGFMIQSGDAMTAGRDRPEFTVPNEANDSTHHLGTLAFARRSDPNSASSQFYICIGAKERLQYLDQMKYTVFGRVISGLDVALKIGKAPTSGGSDRIVQDSVWRDKLVALKESGQGDIVLMPNGMPMPDRPLKPIYIIRAYQK